MFIYVFDVYIEGNKATTIHVVAKNYEMAKKWMLSPKRYADENKFRVVCVDSYAGYVVEEGDF